MKSYNQHKRRVVVYESREATEDPRIVDIELERAEERGGCPMCHMDTMVNYLFVTEHEYNRLCLNCGYKK